MWRASPRRYGSAPRSPNPNPNPNQNLSTNSNPNPNPNPNQVGAALSFVPWVQVNVVDRFSRGDK